MFYDYPELSAKPSELDLYVCPTRDLARRLRPSIAEQGPWEPIHHGQLRQLILDEGRARGMAVASETYNFGRRASSLVPDMLGEDPGSKRNPHQVFGCIVFNRDVPGRTDAKVSIGFRHCNLQTFALTLVAGAQVAVCSNGIIHGEHVARMSHENVGGMLLDTVQTGFRGWEEQQARAARFFAAMESASLSDSEAARLLLEATRDVVDPDASTPSRRRFRRRACLSSSRVASCWELWLDRARNDGAFEQRNAWSLLNSVNEHAKGYRPRVAETAIRGFGAMLADELSFDADATPSLALVPVDSEL